MRFIFPIMVVLFLFTMAIISLGQWPSILSQFSKVQNKDSNGFPQILEESYPDPKIKIEEEFYVVEGTTINQLRKNVFSVSPIKANGIRYANSSKWWVNWQVFRKETRKGCTIYSIETDVIIRKTLPDWIDHHRAAEPLREAWDKYITASQEYMEKQSEFGIQAAQEIQQVIREIEPRQSCSELENEANALAQNIGKEYANLTQEYRKKTDFGRNLGMVFPKFNKSRS